MSSVIRILIVQFIIFLCAIFLLPLTVVRAQSPSPHLFVSPATGDGVSSVWGVFVGVSTYTHKDLNLTYAHKDAEKLYQFFVTQFQGKIPPDQFKLLQNEQAKRGPILRAIKEVLRRAQRGDVVIIFLAMHGLLDASGEDLFFLTHDADPNLPEDEGVSRHDLLRQVGKSKAGKIVLLLDACHTGAFGSSSKVVQQRAVNAASINRLLKEMGQAQKGLAVFASSSAAEFSHEGKRYCGGHGAFTCGLLTGLRGEADTNQNGLVELRELYDYTYRTVTKSTRGLQNPDIDGRYDNGLPLAYTFGGPKTLMEPAKKKAASSSSVSIEKFQALQQRIRELELEKKAAISLLRPSVPPPGSLVAPPREPEVDERASPLPLPRDITGKDGAPMVLIPQGKFLRGSANRGFDNERPLREVELDAYYLDKYEVTTGLYRQFMKVTGQEAPGFWPLVSADRDIDKAVVGVSWNDAKAYCEWAEKRLPTEAEWEKAARGTEGQTYPWGDMHPTQSLANFNQQWTEEETYSKRIKDVGSYEHGKSPYGVYDMAGNVWEWTADWYDPNYYPISPSQNPKGPESGKTRVVRGGYWGDTTSRWLRSSTRGSNAVGTQGVFLGFRCAKDAS